MAMNGIRRAALAGAALGALFAPTATAQNNLNEITVTAQRRSTVLQDTPVAVSAFTAQQRDILGIQTQQDIALFTPSFTFQDIPNRISIRGVGRLTNALGSDPGVATYQDGIYTSEAAALGFGTLTVERIEVLRGPQGTLYGRNSIGGAVNIISPRPSPEFEGEARITGGNYDLRQFGGYVSGPIVEDVLGFRIASIHTEREGYIENEGLQTPAQVAQIGTALNNPGYTQGPSGQDHWDRDENYNEAALDWQITPDMNLWSKFTWFQYNNAPNWTLLNGPYNVNGASVGALVQNPGRVLLRDANPATLALDNPLAVDTDPVAPGFQNPLLGLNLPGQALPTANNGASIPYPVANTNARDIYTVDSNYVGQLELDNSYNFYFNFDWDVNETYTVRYQGGFQNYQWHLNRDIDYTSRTDINYLETIREEKVFTGHDLQLYVDPKDQPYNLIFGAYYYFEDISQPYTLSDVGNPRLQRPTNFAAALGALAVGGAPATTTPDAYRVNSQLTDGVYYFQQGDVQSDAYAVYGQGEYEFNEQFTARLGLRYTLDQKTGREYQYVVLDGAGRQGFLAGIAQANGFPAPFAPTIGNVLTNFAFNVSDARPLRRHEEEWSAVTGNLGVDFRPAEGHLIYGTFTRGYKAGGFRLGGLQADPVVEEEGINAFELGYKGDLFEGLTFNLTGYYYDYEDLQVERTFTNPATGVVNTELLNAPSARNFGIEVETYYRPFEFIEGLTLAGIYSYANAEFDETFRAFDEGNPQLGNQDLNGQQIPRTPEHKLTLSAIYQFEFLEGFVDASASYSYQSDANFTIFANNRNTRGEEEHRIDARLIWTAPSENFEIQLFARNILDEPSVNGISQTSRTEGALRLVNGLGEPQTYGAEVRLRF